ncbi:MAG: ImmA/IrrE family metallo-endopeptidase [Chloroflexota bacterium]|nr:ImmA/IrrE family metallo-endopeptidase [Chloroflexota bacterium]
MTRAERKGAALRRRLGLTGRVDAEAVANTFGYLVKRLPLVKQKEIEVDGFIGIADWLGPEESRWCIAHCLGHKTMHEGNQLWVYKKTMLGAKYEREADDFAHALLIDGREVAEAGLSDAWEVAEHFGVPKDMVRLQPHLPIERTRSTDRRQCR